MTTINRTYRFTVNSLEGQPLFTLLITREHLDIQKSVPVPAAPAPVIARSNGPAIGGYGEARMTEPQKRYLFRLLAQQGVDGKSAEAYLKQAFQVTALREVSKAAASQLIEQMVADQKEVRHGNA
jgi:hypothetical protein